MPLDVVQGVGQQPQFHPLAAVEGRLNGLHDRLDDLILLHICTHVIQPLRTSAPSDHRKGIVLRTAPTSVPTDEIADLLKYISCVAVDGLAEDVVSAFARLMGCHDDLTH